MTFRNTLRATHFASALCFVAAVILLSGCSKKPERETVPELTCTPDMLSVAFDTFTDTRDGKTYKTVKIGKQTWMAENLDYKSETGTNWCYNDSDSCCKKYGRLYDWETAKTACPAGWHLPAVQEWDNLARALGGKKQYYSNEDMDFYYWDGNAGKKLKAKSGWNDCQGNSDNGTNNFGFSALPGGFYRGGSFYSAGNYGNWWTATEYSDGDAYIRFMVYCYDFVYEGSNRKSNGFSVRCANDN
jgi:uncharacterized protein (TIGR02145 family)